MCGAGRRGEMMGVGLGDCAAVFWCKILPRRKRTFFLLKFLPPTPTPTHPSSQLQPPQRRRQGQGAPGAGPREVPLPLAVSGSSSPGRPPLPLAVLAAPPGRGLLLSSSRGARRCPRVISAYRRSAGAHGAAPGLYLHIDAALGRTALPQSHGYLPHGAVRLYLHIDARRCPRRSFSMVVNLRLAAPAGGLRRCGRRYTEPCGHDVRVGVNGLEFLDSCELCMGPGVGGWGGAVVVGRGENGGGGVGLALCLLCRGMQLSQGNICI